jgi:hypothetical protein
MDIKPYSFRSTFEDNCDAIRAWLTEEQINRVANIEISWPTGTVYDEEDNRDEKATLVAHWEDMTYELIAQELLSWQKLKEFYSANQQIIIETFRPNFCYQKLYTAMADGYDIESSMVCMAAFAAYHWSFGYWYRAKRLEQQRKRQVDSDSSAPA